MDRFLMIKLGFGCWSVWLKSCSQTLKEEGTELPSPKPWRVLLTQPRTEEPYDITYSVFQQNSYSVNSQKIIYAHSASSKLNIFPFHLFFWVIIMRFISTQFLNGPLAFFCNMILWEPFMLWSKYPSNHRNWSVISWLHAI